MKRKGLLIRIDEDQLYEYKAWCARLGISMSSEVRSYIDDTLRQSKQIMANATTPVTELHAMVAKHDALLEEVEDRAYADAHQTADEDEDECQHSGEKEGGEG